MSTPPPEQASLEDLARAEAEAKIAAVKPLEAAYAALRKDRDEFAARDTANVKAVRAARAVALKAGFTERLLTSAGYRDVTELVRPAPARKSATKNAANRDAERAAPRPPVMQPAATTETDTGGAV